MRFPARGGPVGQSASSKKVPQFWGEDFGADGFPPKSAPSSGKLHSSVFGPEFQDWVLGPSGRGFVYLFSVSIRLFVFFCVRLGISLSATGCPRPKGPQKPIISDFPPLGVRSAKTQTLNKLRNFGEKLLGRTDFPPKSAPGVSLFLARAQNFSRTKNSVNHRYRPRGGPTGNKVFFDFGAPSTQGPRKGPAELVVSRCLLDAQAPPW